MIQPAGLGGSPRSGQRRTAVGEGVLDRVLGDVEVAEDAGEDGDGSPSASGDQTIWEMPCSSQYGKTSASGARQSIEYCGWEETKATAPGTGRGRPRSAPASTR